jgi:Mlc titration factor MtfA (ptsG expression regulator)
VFAHDIDMRSGATADAEAADRSTARGRWLRSLVLEHERFARRADRDDETFLDPYAAESLEEFFAVGSEAFFVAPATLKAEQPRLYRLLAEFYRQDPERDRTEQGGQPAPLEGTKKES